MAKLEEILAFESQRESDEAKRQIHLFIDGTFYRAYEWSAWLCCSYVNPFKATRRNFRGYEQDAVFIGFPKDSLGKFTPKGSTVTDIDEGHKIVTLSASMLTSGTGSDTDFTQWRETIPLTQPKEKDTRIPVLANRPVSLTGIMKQVLDYRLEQHSPLDCMLFLSDLQRQLTGIL